MHPRERERDPMVGMARTVVTEGSGRTSRSDP
jgi:hypothetical protein